MMFEHSLINVSVSKILFWFYSMFPVFCSQALIHYTLLALITKIEQKEETRRLLRQYGVAPGHFIQHHRQTAKNINQSSIFLRLLSLSLNEGFFLVILFGIFIKLSCFESSVLWPKLISRFSLVHFLHTIALLMGFNLK